MRKLGFQRAGIIFGEQLPHTCSTASPLPSATSPSSYKDKFKSPACVRTVASNL